MSELDIEFVTLKEMIDIRIFPSQPFIWAMEKIKIEKKKMTKAYKMKEN